MVRFFSHQRQIILQYQICWWYQQDLLPLLQVSWLCQGELSCTCRNKCRAEVKRWMQAIFLNSFTIGLNSFMYIVSISLLLSLLLQFLLVFFILLCKLLLLFFTHSCFTLEKVKYKRCCFTSSHTHVLLELLLTTVTIKIISYTLYWDSCNNSADLTRHLRPFRLETRIFHRF